MRVCLFERSLKLRAVRYAQIRKRLIGQGVPRSRVLDRVLRAKSVEGRNNSSATAHSDEGADDVYNDVGLSLLDLRRSLGGNDKKRKRKLDGENLMEVCNSTENNTA